MALKVETNSEQKLTPLVETEKVVEPVEVLGTMNELMRGKNGGSDARPVARQS